MHASSDSPDDELSFIISSLCWYQQHFGLQCQFGAAGAFATGDVSSMRSFSLARWWFSWGCLYKLHNVFVIVVIINANHIIVFLQIIEIIERMFAYHCRIKVVRVNKLAVISQIFNLDFSPWIGVSYVQTTIPKRPRGQNLSAGSETSIVSTWGDILRSNSPSIVQNPKGGVRLLQLQQYSPKEDVQNIRMPVFSSTNNIQRQLTVYTS